MAQLLIENGPSLLGLIDSFWQKDERGSRRKVKFVLAPSQKWFEVDVVITGLEWADGSGDVFNIKGYVVASTESIPHPRIAGKRSKHIMTYKKVKVADGPTSESTKAFHGVYRVSGSDPRTGTLNF